MATVDAGVLWFSGLGFRPAVWAPPHRADGVDPDRLVPAPDADVAYLSKWDAPAAGYAWGTVLPPVAADAPQITAASLAGPVPGPQPWHPTTPTWPEPWFPGPEYPCRCVEVPPVNPGPQPAPVPIEAGSAVFLIAAMGALLARRAWKAMGRFGDWFTAERGTGPHQNGWV